MIDLSPILFNYVIDEVMRRMIQKYANNKQLCLAEKMLIDLRYADEIALVADNARELPMAITAVPDCTASFGLVLKPLENEVLANKPPNQRHQEEPENVRSFCYLGPVNVASAIRMEDIAQRIARASSAFTNTLRTLCEDDFETLK
ncbi:hypothetical protein AB6A40_001638 [Gnathostoma spinigerum]|uniref:Reverse transcriptase domain-containing protein n=1 Tax=Gnathostoma spinigerum TaxID=75299 RepID=A0ABD6EC58_9BILA